MEPGVVCSSAAAGGGTGTTGTGTGSTLATPAGTGRTAADGEAGGATVPVAGGAESLTVARYERAAFPTFWWSRGTDRGIDSRDSYYGAWWGGGQINGIECYSPTAKGSALPPPFLVAAYMFPVNLLEQWLAYGKGALLQGQAQFSCLSPAARSGRRGQHCCILVPVPYRSRYAKPNSYLHHRRPADPVVLSTGVVVHDYFHRRRICVEEDPGMMYDSTSTSGLLPALRGRLHCGSAPCRPSS